MLALTFRAGPSRLALDVRRVHRVVPRVRLQPLTGGPPWLAGVFIYRGAVVPVIDLHRLLGAGECSDHLGSRLILVHHGPAGRERLLGLLAAEVAEVRDVTPPSRGAGALPGGPSPLGPVLVEGGTILHLADLDRLVTGEIQEQLAALPGELPA